MALAVAARPSPGASATAVVAGCLAMVLAAAALVAVRWLRRRAAPPWVAAGAEWESPDGPWLDTIPRAATVLPSARRRRRPPAQRGGTDQAAADPVPDATTGPEVISGSEPDSPEPDSPEPDSPEPDSPEPDSPEPDSPEPDSPEPDRPEPDRPEPDRPEPDRPEPDRPEPDSPEPDSPEPDSPEPDSPEPDSPEPDRPVAPEPGAPRHSAPTAAKPHGRHTPSPRQRKLLREASRTLEGLLERGEIARTAAAEAAALVEADTAALVVRSVEGPRVLWQHPDGEEPADIWGPATLGALLTVGVPVREVVEGDPLVDYGATALLVVPVPSAGMLAGAVVARRLTPRSFSPAEEDALARLARMAGSALDAASRRGYVAAGTGADPATGFWPRERLLGDLRAALRSAQQHGMPVTMLIAGVVGLGTRRKAKGRRAAEEVLREVSSAVVDTLRVGDVPYRFGHDELALLLPGTDEPAAEAVAERLREMVPAGADGAQLRTATVPVQGIAEDVVLAAVRALAASGH